MNNQEIYNLAHDLAWRMFDDGMIAGAGMTISVICIGYALWKLARS